MPEQKYRERRASVCACPCNSIVCLETLTFLTTIALQRYVLLPRIGLSRPEEQEHYTKNHRERPRRLRHSLHISAPHHLLRQSRRGNLTGEIQILASPSSVHFRALRKSGEAIAKPRTVAASATSAGPRVDCHRTSRDGTVEGFAIASTTNELGVGGEVTRCGPFVTEQEARMALANKVEQAYDFNPQLATANVRQKVECRYTVEQE